MVRWDLSHFRGIVPICEEVEVNRHPICYGVGRSELGLSLRNSFGDILAMNLIFIELFASVNTIEIITVIEFYMVDYLHQLNNFSILLKCFGKLINDLLGRTK